ncbi:MAG: PorP/SprF family type IX secretion system membrane protein [Crocinitomicaceae bacterium]|nr:PorP/SprF family type IX secretion system membrane protein [Crocinitomicaceae bacterium]
MNRFFHILRYPPHYFVSQVLFLCMGSYYVSAQQDWNYTQYVFNLYDINTAYAGNHHIPSFSLRHREQWLGTDGAPQTSVLTFHTPSVNEKLGWGFRMQQETIGARELWMFRPSFAYKVRAGDGKFSFSLAPAFIRQSMNSDKITARDETDPLYLGNRWTSSVFSADAALMYSTLTWFGGVEFSHLNGSKMKWGDGANGSYIVHCNAVAGYLIKLSENDLIAFTGLGRFTTSGQVQAEANATWLWNNFLWLGAGYRIGAGINFLAEWNVSKKLRIGYSIDLPVGEMQTYMGSSHELFLGFNIGSYSPSSIRYF